jgi:hypothetical protein
MSDTAPPTPSTVSYRWINLWEASEHEVAQIDKIIAARGWVKLNLNMTRVLVAELDGRIISFSVVQAMPYVGPLFVSSEHRGLGIAEELADRTMEFLRSIDARGWLVVADSPHVAKICEAREMDRVESPVYVYNSDEKKGLVN